MMKYSYPVLISLLFVIFPAIAHAGDQSTQVEIWLAADYQNDGPVLKEFFKKLNITRVNIQYFKAGIPDGVIAVGPHTSADIGRLAIGLATKYNRKKVTFLLPEELLPENYIAVGTNAFDEGNLVDVDSGSVDQLANPNLSDEQFHELYHRLTHGVDHLQKKFKRKFNN